MLSDKMEVLNMEHLERLSRLLYEHPCTVDDVVSISNHTKQAALLIAQKRARGGVMVPGFTAEEIATITGCSKPAAYRRIEALHERGAEIIQKKARAGKSGPKAVYYALITPWDSFSVPRVVRVKKKNT